MCFCEFHGVVANWSNGWVLEPMIYSQLVRSTHVNLGWLLEFEVCEMGCGGEGSCGSEPLFCVIWCYRWVDSLRIELNCKVLSWCQDLLVVGNPTTSTYLVTEVSEMMWFVWGVKKIHRRLTELRLFPTTRGKDWVFHFSFSSMYW